jgi:hypothetical protein
MFTNEYAEYAENENQRAEISAFHLPLIALTAGGAPTH